MAVRMMTAKQRRTIIRICRDSAKEAAGKAVDSALLTHDTAQEIIGGKDLFEKEIQDLVARYICHRSIDLRVREDRDVGEFADEEVDSTYTYPKGYKVKGIAEQVATLRQLFPELKDATFDESIASRPLPPNAEGWFAIPKWQTLAPTYGEAVEKVLAMIGSKRTFCNYRKGQTGPEYLRQHAKTVKMFQKLGDEQKDHDILVVPAQFGLRHRGRSVRRAHKVFTANEFGLGAFAIGIMVLTHPERLVQWEQLHVDCAGDEFSPEADGGFSVSPYFYFRDGGVGFGTYFVGGPGGDFGSVSGFLSQ